MKGCKSKMANTLIWGPIDGIAQEQRRNKNPRKEKTC